MDPSRLSTRSSLTDELENTPDFSPKLSPLKRNSSQEPAPQLAGAFLRWRLESLNHEIQYFEVAELAVMEAAGKEADRFLSRVQNELSTLEAEKLILLEQGRFIAEGLEDATTAVVSDAYIEELEYAFAHASRNGAAVTRSKVFKNKVAVYLNSIKPYSMHKLYYCNVLGQYLASSEESLGIKCAPIVPFSFETTQLPYMFGTDEATLRSPRNGLMLASPIEEAFDNGEIAIVPCGSLDDNPTEWKVIVLHTGLLDKPCWEDPSTGEKTMWNAIHNKPLVWQNSNRPARRYLYLRYALTWLAARCKGYPGWQEKLPAGTTMWATPDKPGGYLRSSVLRLLASKIDDRAPLPEDFVLAGGFDDPDSESRVQDQASAIVLPCLVRAHLEAKRTKAAEEDDDDDDTDEEEEE